MKSKLKNLIHDLIIGRDAPLGVFGNKQIADFFARARVLLPHEPHSKLVIDEFDGGGKTIRRVMFTSITLGTVIHVEAHSQGGDHQFPVFIYDFLEDF